jgi:DNA-binding MarR family transcriptional regulator
MQPNPTPGLYPGFPAEPATAEEAVVGLLMQAGRKLRTRHPEDQVDPSTFPLAKMLMCHREMRVSDLATKVELDASTVSRQIKQLEDRLLVERTADPADGRASLVRLTPLGEEQIQAAMRRRFLRIKSALDSWDDADKDALRILLNRLANDLRDANDLDETRSISS